MNCRPRIISEVLPVLDEYEPRITGKDLLFFGVKADISSPVPLKYGVDITEEIVYNIISSSKIEGQPLFERVWQEDGFWNFAVSSGALELLAREAALEAERLTPCPLIVTGLTPEHIHARLLSVAQCSRHGAVPSDSAARRALWLALTANPDANRQLILRETGIALDRARRMPHTAGIGAEAALAIAACIEKMIIGS